MTEVVEVVQHTDDNRICESTLPGNESLFFCFYYVCFIKDDSLKSCLQGNLEENRDLFCVVEQFCKDMNPLLTNILASARDSIPCVEYDKDFECLLPHTEAHWPSEGNNEKCICERDQTSFILKSKIRFKDISIYQYIYDYGRNFASSDGTSIHRVPMATA